MLNVGTLIATLTMDHRRFDAAMRSVDRNTGNINRRFEGMGRTLRNLAGLIGAAFAVRQLIQFGGAATQAALAMEALEQKFLVSAGNARGANREFAFARDLAQGLGLDLHGTADAYANLSVAVKGTALEGEQTREIFEAVSQASAVMRLSAEQTGGVFTALEQIVSKGKVSAEELRGQLGERLPGAFRLAAEAIGVTTGELDRMLAAGELTAEQLLPKLAQRLKAEFGPAAVSAGDSAQAAFNRWNNAVFELKAAFGEQLMPILADFAVEATDFVNNKGPEMARIFGVVLVESLGFTVEALDFVVGAWGRMKQTTAEIGAFITGIHLSHLQAQRDALVRQIEAWDEASTAVSAHGGVLGSSVSAFDSTRQAMQNNGVTIEALKAKVQEFDSRIAQAGGTMSGFRDEADDAKSSTDDLRDMLDRARAAVDGWRVSTKDAGDQAETTAGQVQVLWAQAKNLNEILRPTAQTTQNLLDVATDLPPVLQSNAFAAADAAAAVLGLNQEQALAVTGMAANAKEAAILAAKLRGEYGPAIQEATEKMLGLSEKTDTATISLGSFLKEIQTGNAVIDRFLSLAGSILDVIGKLAGGFSSGAKAAGGFFSGITNFFTGGGGGGPSITDLGSVANVGFSNLGDEAATGFMGKLSGILGKSANWLPVVGPLLAAFGGPLLKGIGSLAKKVWGGLKQMFGGPSGAELEARGIADAFRNMAGSLLDDVQNIEAGGVRWKEVNILVRDSYLATGKSVEEAMAALKRLNDASRSESPEAAQAAVDAIQSVIDEARRAADEAGQSLTDYRNDVINNAQQIVDANKAAMDGLLVDTEDTMHRVQSAIESTTDSAAEAFDEMGERWFNELGHMLDAAEDLEKDMVGESIIPDMMDKIVHEIDRMGDAFAKNASDSLSVVENGPGGFRRVDGGPFTPGPSFLPGGGRRGRATPSDTRSRGSDRIVLKVKVVMPDGRELAHAIVPHFDRVLRDAGVG